MRPIAKRAVGIAVTAVCLAALVAGAVILVQRRKAALDEAPRYGLAATPVRVAAARSGSLEITREYLAVIEPAQTTNLSARLTSAVESVAVNEGDWVAANDLLILLDDREITNGIEVARAQIAQAEAELAANEATVSALEKSAAFWAREADRVRGLLADGAAGPSETEAAIDRADQLVGQLRAAQRKSQALAQQVEALRGRVRELETRLSYCTIASPFDGVVSRRHVDTGDQAAPGKTLLVVEDRSSLKAAFDIPQRDIPHVRPDMVVRFRGPDGERSAAVTSIFPSLDQARMLRAEVVLGGHSGHGLDSGAYMPLSVVLDVLEEVVIVPASSVVESPAGRPYVFLVSDGRLRPVEVTILGYSGDDVAVDGIEPGAEVVLSTFLGWSRLSSNLAVEALR